MPKKLSSHHVPQIIVLLLSQPKAHLTKQEKPINKLNAAPSQILYFHVRVLSTAPHVLTAPYVLTAFQLFLLLHKSSKELLGYHCHVVQGNEHSHAKILYLAREHNPNTFYYNCR